MASVIAAAKRGLRGCVTQLARIRYRLLLINLIVCAVPLVGISFAKMHEEQLLGALESDMIHQAQLVRAFGVARLGFAEPRSGAAGAAEVDAAPESALVAAARDTRTRI